MKKLYFASHNNHKVEEVENVLSSNPLIRKNFEILGLSALNFWDDIPETSPNLEGNAFQKANFIYQKYHVDCFADDTGLEVNALHGRPGVYSARYANLSEDFEETGRTSEESLLKKDPTFDDNIQRMLRKMESFQNMNDRKACFRTVICLILQGQPYYFEGRVDGVILQAKQGEKGFGYDPIFQADGFEKSFAELSLEEKNRISHRGKALQQFMKFLETLHQ